jgi:hypothetical protein
MRIAPVALIAFAAAALAQLGGITWNGLQFGMSEDAARRKLGKAFEFVPESIKGDFHLKPDYELAFAGERKLRFKPGVAFGSENRLKTINLELDVPKTVAKENGGGISDVQALIGVVGTGSLYRQLLSKYGRPISAKGQCDDVPIDMVVSGVPSCDALWKGEGQLIGLYWYFSREEGLTLLITYKAQPSGL